MLNDYIAKMWFKTLSDGDLKKERMAAVVRAQNKAVENVDDFGFSVNIALAKSNVERTPLNAGNIKNYYKSEIEPAFKDLSDAQKILCRIDWCICLYRFLDDLRRVPRASWEIQTARFLSALGLREKWAELKDAWQKAEAALPEGERYPSFDAYVTTAETELIRPVDLFWERHARQARCRNGLKQLVRLAAAVFVVYVIGSYSMGVGYPAKVLNHLKPVLVSEKHIMDLNEFPPVSIADYNASTILTGDPDRNWSDRNLMDGDPKTAWAEGEPDAGYNKRLYFNITDKGDVHYIVIYNGDQRTEKDYYNSNRLRTVTLRLDDKFQEYKLTLKDTMGPQYIRVEKKDIDRLWIIINSVYSGGTEDRTCVSEVKIF